MGLAGLQFAIRTVFQYSLVHHLTASINYILSNFEAPVCADQGNAISLALLTYALKEILVKTFTIQRFSFILERIEHIYQVDRSVINFKAYMQLTSGIKMLVLYEELKCNPTHAAHLLTKFFPPSFDIIKQRYPDEDTHLVKDLFKKQEIFNQLFLSLVENEQRRRKYLKDYYPKIYGEEFKSKIRKLGTDYIQALQPTAELEEMARCDVNIPQILLDHREPWIIIKESLEIIKKDGRLTEEYLLEALEKLKIWHEYERENNQRKRLPGSGDTVDRLLQITPTPEELSDSFLSPPIPESTHCVQSPPRPCLPDQENTVSSSQDSEQDPPTTKRKAEEAIIISSDTEGESPPTTLPDIRAHQRDARIKPCVVMLGKNKFIADAALVHLQEHHHRTSTRLQQHSPRRTRSSTSTKKKRRK